MFEQRILPSQHQCLLSAWDNMHVLCSTIILHRWAVEQPPQGTPID